MKIEFEWKCIYESNTGRSMSFRAKVIGGWLVRHNLCHNDGNSVSMVFVHDPNHEWEIYND